MKKLNCILLVDDDPITTFLNKKMMEKLNIAEELITAKNGEEGLVKIQEYCHKNKKNAPEIIFLDINMPIMDGFDFVKEFKNLNIKNKEKTRIAVLTTSSNQTDLERIFDLGVKSYLVKPLTEEGVLNLMSKVK